MTPKQRQDIRKAFTYMTVYEMYVKDTKLPIKANWKQEARALYGDNAFFRMKVAMVVRKLMLTIDSILIIQPEEEKSCQEKKLI